MYKDDVLSLASWDGVIDLGYDGLAHVTLLHHHGMTRQTALTHTAKSIKQ